MNEPINGETAHNKSQVLCNLSMKSLLLSAICFERLNLLVELDSDLLELFFPEVPECKPS